MTSSAAGWEMSVPREPLRPSRREIPALRPGEALVRVAGCGLCHTDIGFWEGGVGTRRPPPLVLGHEVSGYVEDAGLGGEGLVGSAVVVPAVTPCGECRDCRSGLPMVCTRQVMPGNDSDGGFATHLVVPSRGLCRVSGAGPNPDAPLGDAPGLTLRHLAVVADAVSTAFQAVRRSGLRRGGLAVVVGLGGVGGYAAQIAAGLGAVVAGVDVDAQRREAALAKGASAVFDPRAAPPKELKARVRDLSRSAGCPDAGATILECSGTAAGQETAWTFLGRASTLMVVGFTIESVKIRLSNLMALDARALGNWGCAPELYPEIVEEVLRGRIDVVSGTEIRPLSKIAESFDDFVSGRARRRIVLAPDR